MILLPMVASADAVEINGIYYNLITKGKVAEVAHTHYTGNIVIPETVDYDNVTYSVTSIGNRAFVECGGLTSITIPNSVTSIGESAFHGCSGLTSITIPNNVTSIGSWAFNYCSGLTSITIPNSVTRISDYVFSDCSSLTSVTIGSSVTSIGNYAFHDCSGLISITIPNSVTSIGIEAFEGCSGLTSVTIPNSVTSIGSFAFDNCYGLKKVIVSDIAAWCGISFNDSFSNPLSFAHHIYSDDNTEIKDMVIPNSVTSIGSYAFSGCSGLTSITIPNSVTSIDRRAFSYCSGLTSITIGSSVTCIDEGAFSGCSSLSSITIGSSVTSIGGTAFSGCSGLTSIKVDSGNIRYDSRDNCNAIIETGSNTLISGCKNTTIPNSVSSIGSSAFSGCSALTSITIPNSVSSIGSSAFSGCSALTSVTIPNSVKSIDGNAFSGCTSLTSVTIGSGIKSIEYGAFAECTELTDVYCYAENVPNTDSNAFGSWFGPTYIEYVTLHVPAASVNAYNAAEPWKYFKSIVATDKKCEKPVISYENGKLSFSCDTEGVEYHWNISSANTGSGTGSEVTFEPTIIVSVYASKEGYDNSDITTMEFKGTSSQGDVNSDGEVNITDVTYVIDIINQQ